MNPARLLLPALAVAAACSGGGHDPLRHEPEHPLGASAELLRPATCDDLLGDIQADAVAKIELATQQYLEWYGGGSGSSRSAGPAAEAGAAESDASGSSSSAPENFSGTNTQVDGVDEADIVKTDGERIYMLARNELFILRSWPAEETSVEARFTVDGYPYEMFVADGRAVVFSQAADPRSPDTDACGSHYEDYGYWYPCYSGGSVFTKITTVDLTEGAPRLSREVWVEGYYNTSRRHGDQVRAVVNNWGYWFGWNLPGVWEYLYDDDYSYGTISEREARRRIYAWRRDAIAAVYSKSLGEWLPDTLERVEGTLTELDPDCGSFYVTRPGLVDYGMTQVVGVHLTDASQPVTQTSIWGYAHEVYAGHDTMLISQWDYSAWYRAQIDRAREVSNWTILHQFSLRDDGSTLYEGSGVVPGAIVDQFSMDVRDGIVRVATTQTTWRAWWTWEDGDEWTPPVTTNQVLTLENGRHGLTVVGTTGPLAEGERIFSTRFIGEKAYVVTFEQVDPLWAIDLSDPRAPRVLGELHIPGFSDYMHPIGDDHLLTIGRDATEDGRVLGLLLQIFDVSNPTAPRLAHRHAFTDDHYGWSEANWEHKAFTFYDHLGLLAFPYVAYGSYWEDYRSSLEIFAVDTETGFRRVGSVDHTSLTAGMCSSESDYYCRYYGLQVRRGVFIEDYVYSVSNGGVRVNSVADMADVATVPLPR